MIRLRVLAQCALLYLNSYLYLDKKQKYLKTSPISQCMTSICFPVDEFILRSVCIEVLLCTDIR